MLCYHHIIKLCIQLNSRYDNDKKQRHNSFLHNFSLFQVFSWLGHRAKKQCVKNKKVQREEAKEHLSANLTKGRFWYTRIWCTGTLWLVRFINTRALLMQLPFGGGQKPINEWQGVQNSYKQQAKRFPSSKVPLRRTEGLHKNMVNGRCLCNFFHK